VEERRTVNAGRRAMEHMPCDEIKGMRDKVAKVIGDTKEVRREVYGNGKKGIMAKVDDHETYIDMQKGGMKLLKTLVALSGLQGFGILILFLKLYNVI